VRMYSSTWMLVDVAMQLRVYHRRDSRTRPKKEEGLNEFVNRVL
jgi:hypothetical protein